jgi:hypothetical protein
MHPVWERQGSGTLVIHDAGVNAGERQRAGALGEDEGQITGDLTMFHVRVRTEDGIGCGCAVLQEDVSFTTALESSTFAVFLIH